MPFELFVKKLVTVFVSTGVVEVYLLAVVVLSESPAVKVANELVASSKPAHNLGSVPCAFVLSVKLLVDKFAGALGVEFIVNVIVSSSSWKKVSGVPDALNLVVKDPADVPEKFLDRVAPMHPAFEPFSTTVVTSEESSLKSYS